jgi:hypothetical protein
MANAGDIIYILFLVICVWLAIFLDDGDGGGRKRSRSFA